MIFHEEHMRTEMTPPPRRYAARVVATWQRGAGLLQTRITRVMGHSAPFVRLLDSENEPCTDSRFRFLSKDGVREGVRRWPKIARQDFGDDALRCREISGGQICRHVVDVDDTIDTLEGVSMIIYHHDFSK